MISVQVCIFITRRCVPFMETYVCHCDILIHLCIAIINEVYILIQMHAFLGQLRDNVS